MFDIVGQMKVRYIAASDDLSVQFSLMDFVLAGKLDTGIIPSNSSLLSWMKYLHPSGCLEMLPLVVGVLVGAAI
jgi:hypothetical protein